MIVFHSLQEALHRGYHVFERTRDGYVVRTRTARGWALAIVSLREIL